MKSSYPPSSENIASIKKVNIAKLFFQQPEAGVIVSIFVLSFFLTIARPQFFSLDNLFSIARSFSYIAITSIGICLVIITGGIDLSVGSVMGLGGVIAALLLSKGYNLLFSLIVATLSGLGVGLANGVLVCYFNLPPFVVTLGMLNVIRGLCYAFTRGWPITGLPKDFLFLGQGYIWIIPTPVVIMLFISLLFWFILKKTIFGLHVYSIGGNEEASRFSGIPVQRMKIAVFSLSGILAALGGVILTARLGVGESTTAIGYELDAIASAVIGGTSLSGGEGTVLGVVLGAALLGIIRNGLVLMGVSAYWQQMTIGLIIILAVVMDGLRRRSSKM